MVKNKIKNAAKPYGNRGIRGALGSGDRGQRCVGNGGGGVRARELDEPAQWAGEPAAYLGRYQIIIHARRASEK